MASSNKIDRLRPSTDDDRALMAALEPRFINLFEDYARIKFGAQLEVPKDIEKDVILWRKAHVRHTQKNDMRITASEVKGIKSVCVWTLRVNAEIRNQTLVIPPILLDD